MTITHKNRVVTTVSAVASSGLGAFTISAASSGYRTFGAGDDGKSFDVAIVEGTSWEVRKGCTYTHSGTSLARGTLEDSSTGSAVAFTSAAILSVLPTADWGNRVESLLNGLAPGGRLTLTSGTPVTTSDVTGATTVYYTPYLHNVINLWDSTLSQWTPITFSEVSLALGTVTSGANYDVFGYLSGGALTLEKLAWTNDTTRATAVTLQDGRYCKSGDKTRLLLGTFRSTSTTQTEDSAGGTTTQVGGKRFLWNAYNRVTRPISVFDSTDSWSYTTNTIRQANGASGNKVELLLGLADAASAVVNVSALVRVGTRTGGVGVGVDSTTAFSGLRTGVLSDSASYIAFGMCAAYDGMLAAGYHYLAWLERGADGSCVFMGDDGGSDFRSGLTARVQA